MNKSIKKFKSLYVCFLMTVIFILSSMQVSAEEGNTTNNKITVKNDSAGETKSGQLHAFYPAYMVFSEETQKYIDNLDSVSFAWSMIEAEDSESLNTVKGKNGNYSFYYPKDFLLPIKYAKSKGKQIQLNVYMDGSDCTKLLPYEDEREAVLQTIINAIETDITQGEGIYYDGVVVDFEGLRNTDKNKEPILYNGKQISTYYTQFLKELKIELDSLGKKLYVAVNPALYYDGFDYSDILNIADRVIIMAHDYEPLGTLQKNQVLQYTDYDTLKPISSLAPIQLVRKALNDLKRAASDTSQLSKVWLQISFDSAQWQFDVSNEKGWEELSDTTLSRKGRISPSYKAIKARVDNIDGNGQNITYGFNNELQSPYIQYYNTSDKSWNIMIYEDSNSIRAKIELAKAFELGGISLWSLSNIPNYNDSKGKKFYLDGWDAIISEMENYDTVLSGSSKYISFSDNVVEQAIREKLGKDTGKISEWELKNIYRLKLPVGVESLKDIKNLTNLEYLYASQLDLKDISAIGGLTKLRVLYLQRNLITDISALKKLTKLEVLSLSGNQITSISTLASLKNLRKLHLRENKIKSISALKKLTKLEILEVGQNSIKNIDSVINLKNMKQLVVDDNQISDISALDSMKKLKILSMNGNKIADIKSLEKLASLEKLYLKDNQIKNIKPLKDMVNLKELYLMGNSITDYSHIKNVYFKEGFKCDFVIN